MGQLLQPCEQRDVRVASDRGDERGRVARGLHEHGDDACLRALERVVDVLVDAGADLLPGGDHQVEAVARVVQRQHGEHGARVGDERDAARLHDLGKIGIPDEVLKKEGPLSDHEWVLMRKHPEIGESIIKTIHSLHHLCDIIRRHHEKLDGSGYPDGLKKDDITPLVRITTIADIFDALTTNRSYRAKMTHKEACQTLRNMQDQLDQEIVEIFIETLQEQKRLNG